MVTVSASHCSGSMGAKNTRRLQHIPNVSQCFIIHCSSRTQVPAARRFQPHAGLELGEPQPFKGRSAKVLSTTGSVA